MRLPRPECAFRFLLGVDVQNDPGDLAPVRIFRRSVQQTDIGEQSLLVITGQDRGIRRHVGDIGIEQRLKHGIDRSRFDGDLRGTILWIEFSP